MMTKKTTSRERELELSRGMVKKNSLVIISAAIVVAAVLLLVLFNTVLANHQPAIASLEAEWERVLPSTSCQIACNASDRDGDDLNYNWSASGGEISGEGAMVTWIAPASAGSYNITVTVTDGRGGEVQKQVTITVNANEPPITEDLIVTAEHQYLKETPTGYKVGKTKDYDIECIASNTSGELVYDWSCDGGEIIGEGSIITWTAPDVSIKVTVTVVVTDIADNTVTKSIILDVVPCSACIFG